MIGPGRRRTLAATGLAVVLGLGVVGGAVWTDALGAGERFGHLLQRVELAVDPPPDRPTRPTVTVTPRPGLASTGGSDDESPRWDLRSVAPPSPPAPASSVAPVRQPVDVDIVRDPGRVFASQATRDWCAVAAIQTALAILGHGDTSTRFQREIADRIGEWRSRRDSHSGEFGPAAISDALAAYGAPGYEIRAYDTRADALRDAAVALSKTGAPVLLMTWRGAHTWVMSGYRANADPTIFANATISGAYILDPWYPRVSKIWGPSDPPGTFQDGAEMRRNFLPWKRPDGRYPDRDGKFIVVVPTVAAAG